MRTYQLPIGHSGFFSRPQIILDPQLFEGDKLLPHVRKTILDNYFDFMSGHFNGAHDWTMLWLAGSGISYQWASDRGNGDLDVLLGLDFDKFVTDNPEYRFYDRYEIGGALDDLLRRALWPNTSHTSFGPEETSYEVTYYLNPVVEAFDDSIGYINPYAAYNLTEDKWTVKPIELSQDLESLYPASFNEQADANARAAEALLSRHNHLKQQMSTLMPGSPQMRNQEASMALVKAEVKSMFDSIHLGRKNAFNSGGTGYSDFYNYQWQAAKRDGIVTAFNEILNGE